METYLWKINKEKLKKTNLALYSNFIKLNYKTNLGNDFNKIWQWSVNNPKMFWKSIWDFTKVKGDLGNILLQESNIFFKNKFVLFNFSLLIFQRYVFINSLCQKNLILNSLKLW